MTVVDTWTGRTACALQAALRMTNEGFAEHLGVAVRTVAGWHRSPDIVPRPEMQLALDTTYERASDHVHRRFSLLSRPAEEPAQAQALRVAIAVVVRHEEVLLVCRRGDDALTWQFPAGMVKPGGSPETVAVQETLAETGVHCAARQHLGGRLHPSTGVLAEYYLCEHLTGEAGNLDPQENVDVTWVPTSALTRFIPAEKIFEPILSALEDA
ncbi:MULTISPECIES: NUDIX hydrolase [unclassified Streptomyces]|uniref:NUDIX hydrolase n=1 Tax=unclassified Streptomyces TaxID=2593676 RepID=UPI0022591182|nr:MULTISPECIES: NUDIX domain-containing protein [unclassified Streptomyces]MCX4863482.1 NUDIX domain-containing protein [Streptomyces sp. NBC_00906]MCX4894720.1 NUDIX domain-containing protein [Streptomyces sp. NBC_00892]